MKAKSTLTSWVESKGGFQCNRLILHSLEWLNKREERAFCTFSQQLNNPHALWIDRLPRELEKGRDGEKGRNRGRACCALWYCGGFCVCVGSAVSSLGPGQGPHSARVCVAKLSGEGGHSWLGDNALKFPALTSSVESDILALQLHKAT